VITKELGKLETADAGTAIGLSKVDGTLNVTDGVTTTV
jgi:hypothetical protein